MEKSPEAFRTISEVADDLDVPQHVLRFWETKFSQIKPMKRAGGRRYYRPNDVDLLRGIRHLLYGEGYTIKGVQKILREQNVSFVTEVGQTGKIPAMALSDDDGDDPELMDRAAGSSGGGTLALGDAGIKSLSEALENLQAAQALLAIKEQAEGS